MNQTPRGPVMWVKCRAVVLKVCSPDQQPSASPGNRLDMHILRPHPRPAESETLGEGPAICFNKTSGVILAQPKFENQWSRVCLRGVARREPWQTK